MPRHNSAIQQCIQSSYIVVVTWRPTTTVQMLNMMLLLDQHLSLTLQCIQTQPNQQGFSRPHILNQSHYSISHIMRRPRPFSLTDEYTSSLYLLRR